MTDEHITMMPTIGLEPFLEEHEYTTDVREAHPIDEDVLHSVCDTKMGPVLLEYDLAMVQAVAVREVLPYNNDHETWITTDLESGADTGSVNYYQVASQSFYELLTVAYQRYDGVYVEAEDFPDIVEAHTRQYLKDVHGYEGDFGGNDVTLCNAQNDVHWLEDEEPENGHYAFTDARGLVVEEGTHTE